MPLVLQKLSADTWHVACCSSLRCFALLAFRRCCHRRCRRASASDRQDIPDELLASASALANAQISKPTPAPPIPEHTGIKAMLEELVHDIRHIPSTENLFWAGVGAGAAAALHPLDPTANQDLSGPSLDKFFKPGAILGQSYTLLPVSVTIYAIGRATDNGSGANSFPSGHAADTMAFATALERHLNWKFFVPAYAAATYVAISRLHANVHFPSDVAAGAAVGIISGRTVTRTGHPAYPVQVTSVPGGFAIVYVRQDESATASR